MNKGFEKHGVAVMIRNQLLRAMKDIKPKGGRLIELNLNGVVPLQILVAHAPTAVDDDIEKDRFYEAIQETVTSTGFTDSIILGDMNAKMYARREGEEKVMGQWMLGNTAQLWAQSPQTRDNRLRLVGFCEANNLLVKNISFQKEDREKCTFREPETKRGPPWNSTRYAEIGYIINKQRWKTAFSTLLQMFGQI